MSQSVLVIDDDESTCELLAESLGPRFDVAWTTEPARAEGMLSERAFDVVLTDVRMLEIDGIDLCARLVKRFPRLPVVVMTAFASVDLAVSAMRAGASDFLTKPLDGQQLGPALERAIAEATLRNALNGRQASREGRTAYGELVGASAPMRAVYELLDRAAPSEASVLISGESGTGKEVLARTITQRSGRADRPFIAVHCAALPEPLLDSELFGHAPGAGSDAHDAHDGLLAQAANGTLFLDEIGELPPSLQAKLLRVLQERRVRPVGSEREIPLDVRLICATSRALESAIAERRFRADLYYRINVIQIALPRLAARGDDVLLLAEHFLAQLRRDGGEALALSAEAQGLLLAYPWPGNVRELESCMQRAVVLARGPSVAAGDLPETIRTYRPSSAAASAASPEPVELVALEEIERRYILRVLAALHGNKSRAAQVLGLDRKTLYRRLERYGALGEQRPNGAASGAPEA